LLQWTFSFQILNWFFIPQYRGMKYKLSNLQFIFRNVVLNSLNLVFYLWTEKNWEKVRCKQVHLDKKLFWRKEFARYRQFPLCTGSIPYKNREKTSVLHKMSVDDRFPLWTESVVDRFYCIIIGRLGILDLWVIEWRTLKLYQYIPI
jgi:hypothetical protein